MVLEVSGQVDTRDQVDTLFESEFCHFRVAEFRRNRRNVCNSGHKGRLLVPVFVRAEARIERVQSFEMRCRFRIVVLNFSWVILVYTGLVWVYRAISTRLVTTAACCKRMTSIFVVALVFVLGIVSGW